MKRIVLTLLSIAVLSGLGCPVMGCVVARGNFALYTAEEAHRSQEEKCPRGDILNASFQVDGMALADAAFDGAEYAIERTTKLFTPIP